MTVLYKITNVPNWLV